MMEISYTRKDGCAGKMRFEESVFLPVLSARDFKKILDVIAMSHECEKHVMQLNDFINGEIERITGERDKCKNAKITAKLNTELKKWISFNAALVKAFQVEEKTDAEAKIRCKKATVYTLRWTSEGAAIIPEEGYSFNKYGLTFYVYNLKGEKTHHVIVPSFGMSIVCGSTRKEAIAALTSELVDRLPMFRLKNANMHKTFIKRMIDAGYQDVLESNADIYEYWPEEPESVPETATTDRDKIPSDPEKSPRPIETGENAADHAERVPAQVRAKAEQAVPESPTPRIKAALPGSPRLYWYRTPYKRDIRVLNSPCLLYRRIHIPGSYMPYTRTMYTPYTPARSIRSMYHKRNAPHYIDTS